MTLVILAHHFLVRLPQRLMQRDLTPTTARASSPLVAPPERERGARTAGRSWRAAGRRALAPADPLAPQPGRRALLAAGRAPSAQCWRCQPPWRCWPTSTSVRWPLIAPTASASWRTSPSSLALASAGKVSLSC